MNICLCSMNCFLRNFSSSAGLLLVKEMFNHQFSHFFRLFLINYASLRAVPVVGSLVVVA